MNAVECLYGRILRALLLLSTCILVALGAALELARMTNTGVSLASHDEALLSRSETPCDSRPQWAHARVYPLSWFGPVRKRSIRQGLRVVQDYHPDCENPSTKLGLFWIFVGS